MIIQKFRRMAGGRLKLWGAALACGGLATALVVYSPTAAQGAKEGLLLCGQVMIPALFPFFVLSGIFAAIAQKTRPSAGQSRRQAVGVVLIGFLGGYPMGAKTAAQLLDRGLLSRAQAQRLMLFCVNAGPAYLIGVVGSALLGSRRAGLLAFLSLLIAGLLLGLCGRWLPEEASPAPSGAQPRKGRALFVEQSGQRADQLLLNAVTQATATMMGVCAWVVLFSCLCALLQLLPAALRPAIPALTAFLEVSSGTVMAARVGTSLPVLCAILGWGGLSVHCQILGDLRRSGLRLRWFWAARAIHGALAAVICAQLTRWFPCETAAVALLSGAQAIRPWAVSAPAAAALLGFCAFLILDLDLNRKLC
ncbi:MAG: hypothetical protein FWH26_01030 [Oscillospiraceae bacterium]|nr:hypothetical protein [Oscillospiraceae bacterium]